MNTQKKMEQLYTKLHQLAHEKEYEIINEILSCLDVTQDPIILVCGTLRATGPIKDKLDHWQVLLDDARRVAPQKYINGLIK